MLVRLPKDQLELPPSSAAMTRTGSSPTRRSARTRAARSRCTACRSSRPTSRRPRSSARATTRRSTRATGGTVLFGPAGRPLPMLPLEIDAKGRLRAHGQLQRGRRAVVVGRSQQEADVVIRKVVRFLDQRTGTAPFLRKTLRYLFPDHWSFLLGEVALYAFMVLVATGIYLAFFFVDSTHQVVYHGSYLPLRGQHDERGVPLRRRPLALDEGGAADPADASLGGERVPRRDHPAPVPRVLHGCVPQAARPDVLHRRHDAHPRAARGVHGLLARRRPHVGHGALHRLLGRDVDPVRRREPR